MLYYKRKSQIEAYYSILNYVLRMLYCAKKLSVVSMPIIKNELDVIKGIYGIYYHHHTFTKNKPPAAAVLTNNMTIPIIHARSII